MPKKRLTNEEFKTKANSLHNNIYDYSSTEYVTAHIPVVVICKEHGSFHIKPTDHLSKMMGCPLCLGRYHRTGLTEFVKRAKAVHGDKYDYSQVIYTRTHAKVVVICKEHGVFHIEPVRHISQKQGCKKCGDIKVTNCSVSRRLTTEQFIHNATVVHGDTYDYSLVRYINSSTKVKIGCKKHGVFDQSPNGHISKGAGCPRCARENFHKGIGGYSEGWFIINPECAIVPAQIYVIHMICGTDNFIKVGITTKTLKQRFSRAKVGDKYISKKVIRVEPLPLYQAFKLEQQILFELKEFKYFPNYVFEGKTECFKNRDVVISAINGIINERLSSNEIV